MFTVLKHTANLLSDKSLSDIKQPLLY